MAGPGVSAPIGVLRLNLWESNTHTYPVRIFSLPLCASPIDKVYPSITMHRVCEGSRSAVCMASVSLCERVCVFVCKRSTRLVNVCVCNDFCARARTRASMCVFASTSKPHCAACCCCCCCCCAPKILQCYKSGIIMAVCGRAQRSQCAGPMKTIGYVCVCLCVRKILSLTDRRIRMDYAMPHTWRSCSGALCRTDVGPASAT